MRHQLVFVAFVCLGVVTAAMAEQSASATANFLSGGAVSALKAAARNSSAPAKKKECIERIPDSVLTPLYKELIASRISKNDLDLLERFYSSPLGLRYAKAIHARKNPPDVFRPAELSQLQSSLRAIPQEALFRAASSRDPKVEEKERAIVKPLIDACSGAV